MLNTEEDAREDPAVPQTTPPTDAPTDATADSATDSATDSGGSTMPDGGPSHAGATHQGTSKSAGRKWPRRLVILAVLLAAAWGGYEYGHYRNLHPQTSDAYLNAHVVRVAPQITGRVLRVQVGDHQHVEEGQLLLEIDPEPFEVAVEQAEAQLDLARQDAAAAAAMVEAARAEVAQREAHLKDVEANAARTLTLVEKGTLPEARGDDARAASSEAQAALAAGNAELQRALNQLGAPGEHNARVRVAAATVAMARLDLSYTKVIAPTAGIVGEVAIRPGAMVEPGQALFPLVEDGSFWVDANFKETDLERIAEGQSATITVDIYSDITFLGTVMSVSPASGTAFSLLPPENATGNWVKVTQRFPVRLRILDADSSHPLRIGASSAVTIDTTSRDR